MNEMDKTGRLGGDLHGAAALDSRSYPRVANLQKTAKLNPRHTHGTGRAGGAGNYPDTPAQIQSLGDIETWPECLDREKAMVEAMRREWLTSVADTGLCMSEAAGVFDVCLSQMQKLSKRLLVKFSKYPPNRSETVPPKRLRSLLCAGLTRAEIAAQYGVSRACITVACKRHGITIGSRK